MKTSLLRAIAPLIALIALIGEEFGITFTAEQLDTVIAALAIVVTAIQSSIRPPKIPANVIALLLLPALIVGTATTQTGCQSIKDAWSHPTARTVIQTGIRGIAYLVAANNPALAPVVSAVTASLSVDGLSPTGFEDRARELIDDQPLDPAERLLIAPLVDELIRVYAVAYDAYLDSDQRDRDMERLLDALVRAIEEGVSLASSPAEASPPPRVDLGFDRIVLQID